MNETEMTCFEGQALEQRSKWLERVDFRIRALRKEELDLQLLSQVGWEIDS